MDIAAHQDARKGMAHLLAEPEQADRAAFREFFAIGHHVFPSPPLDGEGGEGWSLQKRHYLARPPPPPNHYGRRFVPRTNQRAAAIPSRGRAFGSRGNGPRGVHWGSSV